MVSTKNYALRRERKDNVEISVELSKYYLAQGKRKDQQGLQEFLSWFVPDKVILHVKSFTLWVFNTANPQYSLISLNTSAPF